MVEERLLVEITEGLDGVGVVQLTRHDIRALDVASWIGGIERSTVEAQAARHLIVGRRHRGVGARRRRRRNHDRRHSRSGLVRAIEAQQRHTGLGQLLNLEFVLGQRTPEAYFDRALERLELHRSRCHVAINRVRPPLNERMNAHEFERLAPARSDDRVV